MKTRTGGKRWRERTVEAIRTAKLAMNAMIRFALQAPHFDS